MSKNVPPAREALNAASRNLSLGTVVGKAGSNPSSDDRSEAANHVLSWFGFAEVHSNGQDAASKTIDASISIDESFDEGRISDLSKEALVS